LSKVYKGKIAQKSVGDKWIKGEGSAERWYGVGRGETAAEAQKDV